VVLEAVAVALEERISAWWTEPVDHRCGGRVVAEDLTPRALNGLLEVTIRLARS
jgi:hypothetical protein